MHDPDIERTVVYLHFVPSSSGWFCSSWSLAKHNNNYNNNSKVRRFSSCCRGSASHATYSVFGTNNINNKTDYIAQVFF